MITFAHISDTHLTPGDNTEFRAHHYSERLQTYIRERHEEGRHAGHTYDVPSSVASRALIDEINNLPFDLDFVLHTGDVMTDPDGVEEYQTVTDIFRHLKAPVFYLAGNHDNAHFLRTLMPDIAAPHATLDYVIERNGARVICLDSATPGVDHAGGVTDEQLAWLRAQLTAASAMPTIIAIHHPPVDFDIDALRPLPFDRADELRATIKTSNVRVDAVLSGHIHQAIDTVQDGVLYACVQSPFGQMPFYPAVATRAHTAKPNPGFNVVVVTDERTFIRRCAYGNPVAAN